MKVKNPKKAMDQSIINVFSMTSWASLILGLAHVLQGILISPSLPWLVAKKPRG
jgi:hypothetical protein